MRTTLTPLFTLLLSLLATASYGQSGVWQLLTPPVPPNTIISALYCVDDQTLIVASNNTIDNALLLLRSTDGGDSWTDVTANTTPLLSQAKVNCFAGDGDTIIAKIAINDFYKSTDRGLTWQKFGQDRSMSSTKMTYNPISGIGWTPDSQQSVFKSEDSWQTHRLIFNGLTNQHYRTVEAIGSGDTVLLGGYQATSTPSVQMARSTDGGQNWHIPTGLPTAGKVENIACKGLNCYMAWEKIVGGSTGGGGFFPVPMQEPLGQT